MKELTMEEKAKAYDKAIEELRGLLEGIHEEKCEIMEEDITNIFPELKENEDEKIRKRIINALVEWEEKCSFPGDSCDMIAWLEKQGEQNLADKIEPKFKVGDVMRTKQEAADGFADGMPVVVSIDEEYYHCNNELIAIKDQDSYEYPPMNRIQKPADKVEPRQEKLTEFEKAVKQVMEEAIECGDTRNLKADADMLLSSVHKSAWSEEDEKKLRGICNYISCSDSPEGFEEWIDWLSSLRPQSRWKPSDEQMQALKDALNDAIWQYDFKGSLIKEEVTRKHAETIESLYNDLKKLRED